AASTIEQQLGHDASSGSLETNPSLRSVTSIHQLVERVEDDNGPGVVTRALHRSPRPSGRSSRFHGSARIEKARSACLPSFDHGASQGRRAAMIRRCP
ncbi:MAG TPA: hypothetical protein VKG87_11535, partial [Terriglobales bacterium]|nr:hypothetical protein [Terriglobales bacterium]